MCHACVQVKVQLLELASLTSGGEKLNYLIKGKQFKKSLLFF